MLQEDQARPNDCVTSFKLKIKYVQAYESFLTCVFMNDHFERKVSKKKVTQ